MQRQNKLAHVSTNHTYEAISVSDPSEKEKLEVGLH